MITHTYTQEHTSILYTYTYAFSLTHLLTNSYMHTHTYTHARTHKHSHTHTHTHTQVSELERSRVVTVACGLRSPHTLAATGNDVVWAWGNGSFGKLGRDSVDTTSLPQKVRIYL